MHGIALSPVYLCTQSRSCAHVLCTQSPCAFVLLCARSSSCVYVLCTDFVLRAEAHRGAIVAAGALPALVSALASSTSEATRENCAVALKCISQTGVWSRE